VVRPNKTNKSAIQQQAAGEAKTHVIPRDWKHQVLENTKVGLKAKGYPKDLQ
jgi:hypothetical protein